MIVQIDKFIKDHQELKLDSIGLSKETGEIHFIFKKGDGYVGIGVHPDNIKTFNYIEKNEKCCENCCELCSDGKAPYCMPNGEFKEVLSMNYVCDNYSDCRVKIKKFCEENKIEPFGEYLKRIGKGNIGIKK